MNEQREISTIERFRRDVNVVVFLADSAALTATVPFRRNLGERAIGTRGFVGLVLMLLYTLAWPREPLHWYLVWIAIFVGCCCFRRWEAVRRRRKGWTGHSRYEGESLWYPLAQRLSRHPQKWSQEQFKMRGEPMCLFVSGMMLLAMDRALGTWLVLASICSMLSSAVHGAVAHRRRLDLNDIRAEQRSRCSNSHHNY